MANPTAPPGNKKNKKISILANISIVDSACSEETTGRRRKKKKKKKRKVEYEGRKPGSLADLISRSSFLPRSETVEKHGWVAAVRAKKHCKNADGRAQETTAQHCYLALAHCRLFEARLYRASRFFLPSK